MVNPANLLALGYCEDWGGELIRDGDDWLVVNATSKLGNVQSLRFSGGKARKLGKPLGRHSLTAANDNANDNEPIDVWAESQSPTLPFGLLPPIVEEFARTQGGTMGVDPGGLAVAALAVCAAATSDDIKNQGEEA